MFYFLKKWTKIKKKNLKSKILPQTWVGVGGGAVSIRECSRIKGVKQKIRERKLRSDANWQRALKHKRRKTRDGCSLPGYRQGLLEYL
jgi:hypothetical protein